LTILAVTDDFLKLSPEMREKSATMRKRSIS
jgi:hypothetical protein